jgi:hypothetical protein
MRRVKFLLLLPLFTTVAVATSTSAAEATTYTCSAGTPQQFNIGFSNVVNNTVTVNLANGTGLPGGFLAQSFGPSFPAQQTTGQFVESFTNERTTKTITRNVSGPSWVTWDSTPTVPGALATGTVIDNGPAYNLFGPASEAALKAKGINMPVLTFSNGLLILHQVIPASGTPYIDNFSLTGKETDGCALLAG